ncbi:hypothetical protein HY642_03860 [Candidatus Woesearchaeota archaeon]|nr:hypothetical protein [Candidatus Woesearchaeota archaeon]
MNPRLLTRSPVQWAVKEDIEAYAVRQAQSCKYLGVLFGMIEKNFPKTKQLLGALLCVHVRQYQDLAALIDVPDGPRASHYFDAMYAAMWVNPTDTAPVALERILAIQGVSYLRGEDRYFLLKGYDSPQNQRFKPVWQRFHKDAGGNAERVFNFMAGFEGNAAVIAAALHVEDKVMREVWRHNDVA